MMVYVENEQKCQDHQFLFFWQVWHNICIAYRDSDDISLAEALSKDFESLYSKEVSWPYHFPFLL